MELAATDPGCLHELFETQADNHPNRTAIMCGDMVWSYRDVDHRTNQIARYLRMNGVGPGSFVALYFDRSEKPIFSILGVLKAGAAYIPLDPSYPPDRIKHIVTDAQVCMLLTEHSLAEQARESFSGSILILDDQHANISAEPTERLPRSETGVTPQDLCYILFTSGTTGLPKGIMTEHRNVVRFAQSFNDVLQLQEHDRVYQGFALGFDGSVEEMWMAFSNGLPLVVGTPDVVRLGNETARLFREKGVTVFSTVPTFLGMITEELPTIRLIIVSGEPCPPKLVERWVTSERRMLNVYGPTETTVNTTVEDCKPGKPITIGKPLRGYTTYILSDTMQPLPPGEAGELYIGGIGVARGYLHQPELSARHFIPNPFNPDQTDDRLYRTGDLVSLDPSGALLFLGRIDRQVKIRGFRIELSEIESVLREHPQVSAAVVNVYEHGDLKELAAYVVLKNPKDSFDNDGLFDVLHGKLPPYMIPSFLELLERLPTLSSGKVDRKALPVPTQHFMRKHRNIVAPRNELETKIAKVWEEIFKMSPISVEDDFFMDLGGYSLLAAQVVSRLRNDYNIEVAIRDMYRYTTIARLAEKIEQQRSSIPPEASAHSASPSSPPCSSRDVFHRVPTWTRYTVAVLQILSLLFFYGLGTLPVLVVTLTVIGVIQGGTTFTTLILVLLAFLFFTFPILLILSIFLKWLIIGRYKPGEYPLWGFYYFRWWLASRAQALSGISLLSGTPVMSLYYRLMGASVGKHTLLDTPACNIYDLVHIGEDTCIGSGTQLLGYRIEDGLLKIGSIHVGNRCFVGTHSALGLNTRMGDDCKLDDLSYLPDSTEMKPGESRRGSPAEMADVSVPNIEESNALPRKPFLFGIYYFLAAEVLVTLLGTTLLPTVLVMVAGYWLGGVPLLLLSLYLATPITYVAFCFIVVLIKKLILPQVEPGTYAVESWYFLRKWMLDALMAISRVTAHTIYTTIYLPPWLRMLGAKIGKRAEISTVTQMTPDLTIIEDESFFADGSMVGGRRLYRGHVRFDYNRIGRRSFVGNNALLSVGASLGDQCLLGVLSVPAQGTDTQVEPGTEWLGSPSFRLPYRQKVEGFSLSETFQPTLRLYILRYFIDGMRILLPNFIISTSLLLYVAVIVFSFLYLPLWAVFIMGAIAGFLSALLSALFVALLKILLMGTFKPVIKPLWCVYVWFNELLNGAYETVGAPVLAPLMGTPFFNWYLRLMGCRIGKHCYIGTSLFSEFDLVDIGDYAALNQGVVIQNHLFEDRIMKSDYLRIGDECSVGNMAVVLYDTEMKTGSKIAPLSLLMKGETLPPHSRWIGIPTQRVD